MTPDRDAVTRWLIDLLEADPNGYKVGDGGAPAGALEYPYLVVWPIPGGSRSGPPLGASQADATYVYQVDSVGLTRQQAEALASRQADRVSGRGPGGEYVVAAADPPGMHVSDRIADVSAGAAPEGDRPNEVWSSADRYAISVTAQT